jgi:hypothetical protein
MKSITLRYTGTAPLKIPKEHIEDKQQYLQPGDTTLPTATWHRFGASAELADLIVSGAIVPVHTKHEFQPEDAHCIGCSATREDAEAERAAALPAKKAPDVPRAP